MKISIIGGGYVGLISSICFAELGHCINLIEIDGEKAAAINSARPPIYEKGLEELLIKHAGIDLTATTDYSGIPGSDVTFICVGTPPKADGSADLSMIESASRSIGSALKLKDEDRYHVVTVKSTVPPGTTQNTVIPTVLKESGRTRSEIGFVMNPEFLREGLAIQDFMNPDRIVIGSMNRRDGDIVQSLYSDLEAPVVRTGIMAAEMIKYASNAMLATKISFANEVGNICKRLDVDVYEVMRGVGMDHRISPHFLNAGAGFGGSCFPKDVSGLLSLAKSLGEEPVLLRSVLQVNENQPLRMVELLQKRIGDLKGKRIAILGLAFKNDTDDARESRSIPVIENLLMKGASVFAYDPKANESMSRIHPGIDYCQNASEALTGADACLIMTEWPEFGQLEGEFDLMRTRVIIEGRRILSCRDSEGICW